VIPGDIELWQIVASWAATLPTVAAIIVYDERRLRGEQRGRAWPPSSRDAAIYALWTLGVHHLCVPIHFVRTRRTLGGIGLGLVGLAIVVGVDVCAQLATEQAIKMLGL
jgi:hypothetical protein